MFCKSSNEQPNKNSEKTLKTFDILIGQNDSGPEDGVYITFAVCQIRRSVYNETARRRLPAPAWRRTSFRFSRNNSPAGELFRR